MVGPWRSRDPTLFETYPSRANRNIPLTNLSAKLLNKEKLRNFLFVSFFAGNRADHKILMYDGFFIFVISKWGDHDKAGQLAPFKAGLVVPYNL